MRIPRTTRASLLVLSCLVLGLGCSDDVMGPEIQVRPGNGDLARVGSGLRLLFPEGAGELEGIRVELWDETGVPPAHCDFGSPAPSRPVFHPRNDRSPDLCTRMQVEIWDLEGRKVRFVEDTPTEGPGLRYGWNGRDDAGNDLPGGYYPTTIICLDSGGEFRFDGHFYFIGGAEKSRCEWPVWIRDLDPAEIGGKAEFGPFPISFQTQKLDPFDGSQLALVNFASPFLLRVRATGMVPFEREIRFQEEKVTEVTVELAPAEPPEDKEP